MNKIIPRLPVKVQKSESVSGGDINNAYRLTTADGVFFMKINRVSKYPNLFEKEANGLKPLPVHTHCLHQRLLLMMKTIITSTCF